ncbi:hypothetical protein H0H93_014336 [Arthromyces matolae]|nr:hypothetical protein H0H93_014336 [Arthromyces matolae]
MRLAAYTVYPLATNATFSRIASITIPNVYPDAWAAAGASLAFLHSSSVTVWNYETNLFVSWDHGIPNVIEVFLLKEHIVLINHLNIYLCEIPPPSSSTGDGRLSKTKTNSIVPIKSYRHPHGIYEDLTIPSSDWCSHHDDVIHFSVLAINEQYLDHYAITYPQESREPEIQFLGSALLPRSVDEISLACIGANCSIIAINDTKTISVLLAPICGDWHDDGDDVDDDGDWQGPVAKQVEIWKVDGGLEIIELSICTATGRLVVLTTDGKFHVVDYLGPKYRYRCDSEKSLVQ